MVLAKVWEKHAGVVDQDCRIAWKVSKSKAQDGKS